MRVLELKVPPVALLAIFAIVIYGVARLTPGAILIIPGKEIIGAILVFFGALVVSLGVLAFRSHKTTVNPLTPGESSVIVQDGIYRVTRNPMYLGFLFLLSAWAIFLSNAFAALALPLFVAYMNQYQIKPEERVLLAKFGPEFSTYMSTVRRWL
ncbi:methyltransferase family protein [Billgrantia endophytica]|uniref:Isoprenylcysteine carboxylmethyltransferase family protein n=1 Tax=Billgrantia endophytica TaxID=2033802 RepID=A0A2N7TZI9_9GAMM|nr:isoprenylcysteine carboxylmethyltransferase family protein [Halomonas endophytica]PMR73600.1 isoprenylcysteine carboxylmethyltransferase family protein [Halomonas endophytica]